MFQTLSSNVKLCIYLIYKNWLIIMMLSGPFFAKYWLGIQLRRFNPSLASNSFPHSDSIPPFYQVCISTFRKLLDIYPGISVSSIKTRDFYQRLLSEKKSA